MGHDSGQERKSSGDIDPLFHELAAKQKREFTDADPHTLIPDALDTFRKEMADNGWDCGQDDEELFELAMHPEQYRSYKSGQAKKNFLTDLQKAKDAALGSQLTAEELSAFKHAKADALTAPLAGQVFYEFAGNCECSPVSNLSLVRSIRKVTGSATYRPNGARLFPFLLRSAENSLRSAPSREHASVVAIRWDGLSARLR